MTNKEIANKFNAKLDESKKQISDKFNLCDKDGNLKDVPKLKLNFGGRSNNIKIYYKDLATSNKITLISSLLNSELDEHFKETLLQQFIMNWLDVERLENYINR